jgi:hypothetical protein
VAVVSNSFASYRHSIFMAKSFLDDDQISLFTIRTNQYTHQYLNIFAVSQHSQDCSYKDVTKDEIWTYLGLLFMTGIDRQPKIVDYWSTKSFLYTPW